MCERTPATSPLGLHPRIVLRCPGRRGPPRPAGLLATAGEDPVMGCEGVNAGHDVRTTIGGVLMENGDGRRVND